MSGMSAALEDALLNWMKGTTFTAANATTYVALFTTNPTADDGTGAVEVTGGSYARQPITSSSGWSAISGSGVAAHQISNSGVITFPTPSANWGAVIGIGIYNVVSGTVTTGLLWWNSITSQTINTGVVASLSIGSLILTAD